VERGEAMGGSALFVYVSCFSKDWVVAGETGAPAVCKHGLSYQVGWV